MKAFVTGGSGFVGGVLIRTLIERGDSVMALARSDKSAVIVENCGATAVRGDLDNVEAMADGMAECDVIFHAAAHLEEWGDPEDFRRVNVDGTRNVIEAGMRAAVRRLVHVSTEAVLANESPICNVDESRPRPVDALERYPKTKGQAEEVVEQANGNGIETVIVRPRLIWGAGDTSLLPKLVEAVEAGRFMWMDGGHYLTSTCHVRNVCAGLLAAADAGVPGETYFVTDGEPVEARAFYTELLETQGVDVPQKSLPSSLARVVAKVCEAVWGMLRLKSAPPVTRVAINLVGQEVTLNDAKARTQIGYQSAVSMEQGLAELRKA